MDGRTVSTTARGVRAAAFAGLLGGLLAACTQTTAASGPPPAIVPGVTATAFGSPGAAGCSGEIARFQAVLQSDADTGNVDRSVYNRAEPELTRASTACQLGRDGEARSILAATKSRYGYR